ncbi:MAG: S-layer homology domain-containing protein [Clostridia bacterium]|nr:S-layer homology domain-containing protein [Clostridia bacterium]
MKKTLSIFLAVIMIISSCMSLMTGVSAEDTPTPIYSFNLEDEQAAMSFLVNTHLNASYSKAEAAIRFINNNASQQDQGFTPTPKADEPGTTTNTDLRKSVAQTLKSAQFVVITYKNTSDINLGAIRHEKKSYLYNMKTNMDSYADVIVPTVSGACFRDGGGQYQAPFCMYPFFASSDEELPVGLKQSIYIKSISMFKSYADAESFAKANVASGKTTEYTYAEQTKVDINIDLGYESISDLLAEEIKATEEVTATGAVADPMESHIVYDGSMDYIEWNFASSDLVKRHTTNTNNYTAKYDEVLNAMEFVPKSAGNAGDQGIVAASTSTPEDELTRSQFVTNVPKNYKYMVLTYLNKSEIDTMIHRYALAEGGENRADIKIKKASECDGKWQRVVIDVTDGLILRPGTGTSTSNLCFFPLKGTVSETDSIAWKSLAFFKTKQAAEEYAAQALGSADALPDSERTDAPFIAGYDGRTFKPEGKMTRAEAVTVITRLLVDETTIKGKNTTAFTDVKSGAWYYDYVAYLESLGYLKSYKGEFKPDQPITRAEFVELVYNMGKVQASDKQVSFTDVPATHERYTVIMASASAGLVGGYPDGTFKPDGTITRAEVVKVICSALGRTPTLDGMSKASYVGFADITSAHWAFPYVIEASVEHSTVVDADGNEIWTETHDDTFYLELATDKYIAELDARFEARKKEVLETASEWKLGEGGKVIYVSNDGDDTNDGLTPETAVKTIDKVMKMQTIKTVKAGDVVLFKRGDEWHEKLTTTAGVTYSAYGEGDKPRILGSIEADDASQWIATEKANIYKFNGVIPKEKDVGNMVFNDGEAYGMRVLKEKNKDQTVKIGDNSIVSNGIETWEFPVQPFTGGLDLNHHLAYYHDWNEQTVYLYCEGGNPGDVFDSIEISTKGNVVQAKSNVVIDNLCIRYGATHGVGAGTCENLIVRNCEVGWIGGAIQDLSDAGQGRLGNGIEIYGGANGYYVYNNYVYQCFDCGPTVQWQGSLTPGQTLVEVDTEIRDNVIEKCNSPLEVWCTSSTPNSSNAFAILKNCNLSNNLCRYSGYGFGGYIHQKVDYNMFYGAGHTYAVYEDCYVQNNTMWHIRKYLQKAVPTHVKNGQGFHWRNNTIIMAYDGPLALLGSDTKTASGGLKKYMYTNDTIRQLLADGCYGFNRFMYTLADGQADPNPKK